MYPSQFFYEWMHHHLCTDLRKLKGTTMFYGTVAGETPCKYINDSNSIGQSRFHQTCKNASYCECLSDSWTQMPKQYAGYQVNA